MNLTTTNPVYSPSFTIYTNDTGMSSIIQLYSKSGGGQIRVDDDTNGLILNNSSGHPIRLQTNFADVCVMNSEA